MTPPEGEVTSLDLAKVVDALLEQGTEPDDLHEMLDEAIDAWKEG